jgi:hypothetical protein
MTDWTSWLLGFFSGSGIVGTIYFFLHRRSAAAWDRRWAAEVARAGKGCARCAAYERATQHLRWLVGVKLAGVKWYGPSGGDVLDTLQAAINAAANLPEPNPEAKPSKPSPPVMN